MYWIVTWIWMQLAITTCPGPPVDEYGRFTQAYFQTSQVCYDTVEHFYKKTFKDFDSAREFMEKGLDEFDLKDFDIRMQTEEDYDIARDPCELCE